MLFNVQDLFLELAYPVQRKDFEDLSETQWQLLGKADEKLKPLAKLRDIARIIEDQAPDIIALCEVGGGKSLKNFSRFFLNNKYTPHLRRGNDKRGIHNGFLVRKGLPISAHLKSHRHHPVSFTYAHENEPEAYRVTAEIASVLDMGRPESRKLSRDLPELKIRDANGKLLVTILLAHLKSGYDPYGIDPAGTVRRRAELLALIRIYDSLRADPEAKQSPFVICGDFNGNASRWETAEEFLPIYEQTDWEDALRIAGHQREDCITHITYYLGEKIAKQLDYIFLSPRLQAGITKEKAFVYRYQYEGGTQMRSPLTMSERWRLPSDHYPVICTLDL